MKKQLLSILLVTLFLFNLSGQQANYQIAKNNFEEVEISFSIPPPLIKEIDFKGETFSTIELDGYIKSSDVGNPQLPVLGKLIEIPLCDDLTIEITPGAYDIYDAEELGIRHDLYPAQPSYIKSYTGPIELVKNEETYRTDAFYGAPLAWVEKTGVMRCMNIGNVYVSPVEYNPVTRQVKIYRNIDVTITYVNADIPSTYQMKKLHGNGVFMGLESQVINPIRTQTKDALTTAPIKYLIVANSMFNGQLDGFVAWKKKKGFLVEIAYTNESGVGTTTSSIQSFIKSKYTNATPENPAPTYVLLVGDVQQLPTFTLSANGSSHVSDLSYFTWTGGDDIPDCFYGRFSAQNATHLATILEKTLMYEQYTMPDPSYLGDAVLVAGADSDWSPTHANGQMNYLSGNYINSAYGYNTVNLYLHPASSQAANIRTKLGQGVGYANYTAHCGSDGWSDPAFSTSHIAGLSNANKYGLWIGNCCQSNMFGQNECFGEAIVRAANKGAVAYIGGSDNTTWNEDYYWSVGARSNCNANPTYSANNLGAYDRLFHTHNEPFSEWHTTAGSIIMAGNMAVQASSTSSASKLYYWQVYCLMGDPSLMPYLSIPQTLNLNIPEMMPPGTSNLEIDAVPYAYVALTYNNELIAATFADNNGRANLQFAALTELGQYELAVSAQNYVTAFYPINMVTIDGSYVCASSFGVNDQTPPKVGNRIKFDFNVKNLGTSQATGVYAKLSSSSDYATILTDSLFIGNVNIGEEREFTDVFSCQLSAFYQDLSNAAFTITVYGNDNQSIYNGTVALWAPDFQEQGYVIEEYEGNGDGIINPGEKAKIKVMNVNAGHMDAFDIYSALISNNTAITVLNNYEPIEEMLMNVAATSEFIVQVAPSAVDGGLYRLNYKLKKNNYELLSSIDLPIGGISMEDFESGDFSLFNWTNNSSYPWIIANTGAYQGSYCARSASSLSNSRSSTLQISLNVTVTSDFSYYRRVSSEANYDFFTFSIDGVEKESLSGNVGWGQSSYTIEPGSHTFKFNYSKDYSNASGSDCAWIDNINFPITATVMSTDTTVNFPVGIESHTLDLVVLHPNPALDKITIKSTGQMKNVAIIDLSGRVVEKIQVSNSEYVEIDVRSLATGFYFAQIEYTDKTTTVKKFIKQ